MISCVVLTHTRSLWPSWRRRPTNERNWNRQNHTQMLHDQLQEGVHAVICSTNRRGKALIAGFPFPQTLHVVYPATMEVLATGPLQVPNSNSPRCSQRSNGHNNTPLFSFLCLHLLNSQVARGCNIVFTELVRHTTSGTSCMYKHPPQADHKINLIYAGDVPSP
jgi:hypothetical protein